MEVLRVGALLGLALLTSCSLVSPWDFADAVVNQGITPNLVASANVGSALQDDDSSIVGFVGGAGKVWIISKNGWYAFRSSDLSPAGNQTFATPLSDNDNFDRALWSVVPLADGGLVLTTIVSNYNAGGLDRIELDAKGTQDPVITNTTNGDPFVALAGVKGGDDWTIEWDPGNDTGTFSGGGPTVDTTEAKVLRYRSGPSGLVAVENNPAPTRLGSRRYAVGLSELPVSVWGTASAPNRRTVTVTLPDRVDDSLAAERSNLFFAWTAGGKTFLSPDFATSASGGTDWPATVVEVFDDANRHLGEVYVGSSRWIAIDGGDAVYLLGPDYVRTSDNRRETTLRKYRW